MSDPVSLARAARENLARGLAALQSPSVPQQLLVVAEPIAQAMSALHRVEATHGAASGEAGPMALHGARQALGMLQSQPQGSPAVDQALEAIAGSLGLIHQLATMSAQQPAPVQSAAAFAGTMVMGNQQASVVPMSAAPHTQPSQHNPYAHAEPAPQVVAYPPQAPAQPQWQQPPQPQQPQWQQPPQQPAPQQWQQPAPQAWQQPPQAQAAAAAAAPMDGAGALRVEAELGAHSATNFYKGLSGNDVIDSGGIFIATYQIPEIGRKLMIKVSMPGGYEFEALGVVRWTRDAPNSGADSSPGYGAQFTQISQEGRQLVYRYVRNREPLFHDDL